MEIHIYLLTQLTGKAPLIQVCQMNKRSYFYIYVYTHIFIVFQNIYTMNLKQSLSVSNLLGDPYTL